MIIVDESCTKKFLLVEIGVSILVLLEHFLKISENPLEAVSVKTGQSHLRNSFDTRLSLDIMEQRQFSKIVSLLVVVHNTWKLISFNFLFSCQLPLHNNVEFIAIISLVNDVLVFLEFFFLENVKELLST